MQLLLATSNKHKFAEISRALASISGLRLLNLSAFPELTLPPESGDSMADNARLKAVHAAAVSGLCCLADDSGIEVDALGGEPGLLSARWMPGTDRDRAQAMLRRMVDVAPPLRIARYRCALALAWPATDAERPIITAEATCEGSIACEFRGHNGFGYDPIFEITERTGAPAGCVGCSMAEVAPHIKADISHRARALRLLASTLAELVDNGPTAETLPGAIRSPARQRNGVRADRRNCE